MNKAAEHQHYVPKFILRKFLSNKNKEQVTVFQKSTSRIFTTNITGIMGERRFNEFQIDSDYYASFEAAVCRVEDVVLPAYKKLVEEQKITFSPENAELLGLFIAFQLLRVRAYRDGLASVFKQLSDWLINSGFSPDDIRELQNQTEDSIKKTHLDSVRESIIEFSRIISIKDFVLLKAPKGRYFYLADNPVALHNDEPREGIWGNIGLAVRGIQIYVPLTSKLMLAAWCPSITQRVKDEANKTESKILHIKAKATLGTTMFSPADRTEFNQNMERLETGRRSIKDFISAAESGAPIILGNDNMDHYNSMQVLSARDFIICQRGNFDLARRVVAKEGPTGGWQMRVG